MLIYNVTETLAQTDAAHWEKLAREELGDQVHPKRQLGFCLAREALRLALRQVGLEVEIPNLKLCGFNHLAAAPKFTLSISHTPFCGSAVLADRQEYQSVGIDIEKIDRIVKAPIMERIAHEKDISLRNLQLWCLKEAAFKAAMNTGQFEKPIEFCDIEIGNNVWIHQPSLTHGGWSLQEEREHVLAMAWIRSQNSSPLDHDP